MTLVLIDIFYIVRIRKRAIVQPNQLCRRDKNIKRQKTLQNQMFILMLASVCIFMTTSLPLGVYKITSVRVDNVSLALFQINTIWTGLGWFQTLFYAVNIVIIILY